MPQNPIPVATGITSTNKFVANQLDPQKADWASDRHGTFYTASYLGLGAFAANQAGATISLFSATPGAYTGLCVSNPAASTVNLAIQTVSGALTVASGGITLFGLVTGYAAAGIVTHTTPLTVYSTKVGTTITTPIIQGLADSAATLVGVPTWTKTLNVVPTTVTLNSPFYAQIAGEIIIPPGGYCCVGVAITAGPTSGFWGSISWEEIPLAQV
jgi:hypothetical protein